MSVLLEFGFGKKIITPPQGVALAGYLGRAGNAEGGHDDLHARSMIFRSRGRVFALISLDLLFANKVLTESIRKLVEKRTAIPKENVMVSAIHTHSGPKVWFPKEMDSELVPEGPIAQDWQDNLPGIITDSVSEARRNVSPVQFEYFEGKTDIGASRRKRDPFGEIHLLPNLRKTRKSDFKVLLFREQSGDVAGIYVNANCHPVVLAEDNLEYSADYPRYMLNRLETKFEAPALFTNGAAGDIDPILRGSFEKARKIGFNLADDILNSNENKTCYESCKNAFIEAKKLTVHLPVDDLPSIDEVEDYISEIDELIRINGNSPNTYEDLPLTSPTRDGRVPGLGSMRNEMFDYHGKRLQAERNYAMGRLVQLKRKMRPRGPLDVTKKKMRGEIQAFKFGQKVAILGVPGELFSVLYSEIKNRSYFPYTIVVGYANGVLGYIPDRNSFKQGGYEVNKGTLLAPGTGEEIVKNCVLLLNSLKKNG